ncbi:MAG: 3-oxoadipate enol-lactonase [Hyphomicrobiales bacterium]|nr:3-oxoadipate enol-lactonase [Hyphomicrobiales bacterium]
MTYAETNGTRLHYRFDGAERAPILVLSNSLGTDVGMWDPQITALAERFRVLRYDSRGHGASRVTPGPYTIEQLARDIVGLLDGLGIDCADFCGLSLGGMVGQWLGVHAPERINRLVLCNTTAYLGPADLWNKRIDAVRQGGMAAVADSVLDRWFTAPFLERQSMALSQVRATLLNTPGDGYAACCAAVRDMDQRQDISRIRQPTLVIAGSQDLATPPEDGRFLAERIQGARYVEVNAAHLSNIEETERFTCAVLDFLSP